MTADSLAPNVYAPERQDPLRWFDLYVETGVGRCVSCGAAATHVYRAEASVTQDLVLMPREVAELEPFLGEVAEDFPSCFGHRRFPPTRVVVAAYDRLLSARLEDMVALRAADDAAIRRLEELERIRARRMPVLPRRAPRRKRLRAASPPAWLRRLITPIQY